MFFHGFVHSTESGPNEGLGKARDHREKPTFVMDSHNSARTGHRWKGQYHCVLKDSYDGWFDAT